MFKRLFVLAAALALMAPPAFSQTNPTGTLSGKVVDPQGLAVPGVTVTAEAPTLQGARTATTSVNGDYIITFLPPGDYTVTFELSGFATVKETVRLAGSASIPLNATMALPTVTESVTVVAQAAGEFNQTAQVATSYKAELIEKLPVARTMQQAALLTPGVSSTGPSGAMSISGAASFENVFMVNGVVVQDNLRSTPLQPVHRGRAPGDDDHHRRRLRRVRPLLRRGRERGHEVGRQRAQRVLPHHVRQRRLDRPHPVPQRPAHGQDHPHLRGHPGRPLPQGQAVVLRGDAGAQLRRDAHHELHLHQLPAPARTRSATRAS